MRKVEEYKRHADECRQLATMSSNEETRTQLLRTAEAWEDLALGREVKIARQEGIAPVEQNGDNGEQN